MSRARSCKRAVNLTTAVETYVKGKFVTCSTFVPVARGKPRSGARTHPLRRAGEANRSRARLPADPPLAVRAQCARRSPAFRRNGRELDGSGARQARVRGAGGEGPSRRKRDRASRHPRRGSRRASIGRRSLARRQAHGARQHRAGDEARGSAAQRQPPARFPKPAFVHAHGIDTFYSTRVRGRRWCCCTARREQRSMLRRFTTWRATTGDRLDLRASASRANRSAPTMRGFRQGFVAVLDALGIDRATWSAIHGRQDRDRSGFALSVAGRSGA